MMKTKNSYFHKKEGKYSCDQCDHQESHIKSLVSHIKIMHDGVKYPCRLCNYQATIKKNLARHHRSVHEGVKYPCRQ